MSALDLSAFVSVQTTGYSQTIATTARITVEGRNARRRLTS
jgi:hypothetical protein